MTGISGGPAFLPVNPKQFHWQVEDTVVWLQGRHSLKFGYRLVDRYASPFTHTDTRGSINFGRNYTNNPVTNTGGSGLASLLTGYINNAARGFLLEPYMLRTQEHGLFIQDDFKVSSRFTVNAGLRYEIFRAETEEDNKIVNFDPVNLRLIYAGEDGASSSVNKQTRYGNFAPRLGLTYDLFGDSSTILRTGFAITYYPEQPSASNMIGQQVPYTISQNVSFPTNPTDFSTVRTINDPFPPIAQVKPLTTAELQAANPRVLGHSFDNETPYAEQWHLGIDRRLFNAMAVELTYAGSAGKHLIYCYNPNEVQPGLGSQESRRLIQPLNRLSNMLQCDPRNRSTYHSGQLKVTQRFSNGLQFLGSYTYAKSLDYGGSAASGGGAVGNPQTVTNLAAGHGPSGFDVRHRAVVSWVYELPFGPGRHWLANGGRGRRDRGRLADRRHRDDDDRPSVHGVHADRRQQRRAQLAEPDRLGQTRQSDGGSLVRPHGLRRATGEYLWRQRPRHSLWAGPRELRHVAVEAVHHLGAEQHRVPVGCVQPVQPSGIWLSEPELRLGHCRTDHVHDSRQPVDAVFVEVQFLDRPFHTFAETESRLPHEGHDGTMSTMKTVRAAFIVSIVSSCSSCLSRRPVHT